MRILREHCALVALLAAGCATAAQLTELEVIVVTAQRRAQPLADVPVSLTALSAESIARQGVRETADLVALVPGLSGKAQGLATPVFAIRGVSTNSIGIGGESSVGVFWDEGYFGRLESANLPFFDLERIEVLKGPQSTLFGRNASAGVISLTSRRPGAAAAGNVSVSYGSFERAEASVGLDTPLTDDARIRSAVLYRHGGGSERNVLLGGRFGGGETLAARSTFTLQPSEALDMALIVNYVRDDGGGFPSETLEPALAASGGLPATAYDGRHAMDVPTYEQRRVLAANLQAQWRLSDELTLKSITTGLRTRFERQFDLDGSVLPLLSAHLHDYRNQTFGQELRLLGSGERADWFVGTMLFREQVRQAVDLGYSELALFGAQIVPADSFFTGQPAFAVCSEPFTTAVFGVPCASGASEQLSADGDYTSYAIYGDFAYQLAAAWKLTLGARVSRDQKRFAYAVPPRIGVGPALAGGNVFSSATSGARRHRDSWTSVQPRLVIDYKPAAESIVFFALSRGFKAGGFDPTVEVEQVVFDDESVWAYEVGTRYMLAGGAQIGLSTYYQDYRDYQLQLLRNGVTATVNAPKARSYGAEAEASWEPLDRLRIQAQVAYNDSTFRSAVAGADLAGNRLLYAPRITGYAAADIELLRGARWTASLHAAARHESRQFFTKENRRNESDAGLTVVDASATLALQRPAVQLRLFTRNLLDRRYLIYAVDQGFGVVANRGEPRIIGVELSASF